MKSKVIDLIFGDSLPYKSGLGFFVPALEVPFFESPTWALLAKVVILGCKKRHFQCRYEKSETTFIRQTFPKNEDYGL